MSKLLSEYQKDTFELKNRLVMAPMTRSRAIGNLPNDLMVQYYAQRAGAGLVVTEGTAPAPEGLGYARIPRIFSDAQTDAWRKIADAVQGQGSRIFMQLMHTGRIAHVHNLPAGIRVIGVSDIPAAGQMWTDEEGMLDHSVPEALSTAGVEDVINEFVKAAENAVEAGFDGIELHNANGYLLEQFLNPNVNNRTDRFGGSIENRSRAVLEIARKTAAAIGKDKVGIRFSPFGTYNDLLPYDRAEVQKTYEYLATELNAIGITYIHISLTPDLDNETLQIIRRQFSGTIILCNGFTSQTAETALGEGIADLIAFGQPFLANPDLVTRIETGAALNAPDYKTFYTAGETGYIDYPSLTLADK
ncbi:alkene reductase [Dyadobacter jiangsuensis]|uniref:N-ethylmaleimide reductase n=1 Tax=Dyadobacter jiangsuensis TaxID=1591085 RepID=A0A2P8GEF2_9BACT|nr:alkene reductase [Dyadobacter jiangsuensis]PSL32342.1 N-ethylmaleimide reductase [Dyadobacter jiangsuensis]